MDYEVVTYALPFDDDDVLDLLDENDFISQEDLKEAGVPFGYSTSMFMEAPGNAAEVARHNAADAAETLYADDMEYYEGKHPVAFLWYSVGPENDVLEHGRFTRKVRVVVPEPYVEFAD